MIEKYKSESEVRKTTLGIISAITAVNLKQEKTIPKEQPEYERGGRETLSCLVDPESLIHRIRPDLMKNHRETIEKAKELYPSLESKEYLLSLLNIV